MPGRIHWSDFVHVVSSHPGGQQRLVGVSKGRVGDEKPFLIQDPSREFLGSQSLKFVGRPRRKRRSRIEVRRPLIGSKSRFRKRRNRRRLPHFGRDLPSLIFLYPLTSCAALITWCAAQHRIFVNDD